MKVKRLLSCVTFLIGVLPCVASCQSTGSSSSIDTISSATHTHVFAEGTYPCHDRVCLTCGKTIKATEPHSLKLEKVVEPTCTEAGYSRYVCERCGYEKKSDLVAKLGHDFVVKSHTDATCSQPGITVKECTRCGAIEKDYTAKLDHVFNESLSEVHQPTCTEYGYTLKTCSVCGEKVKTDYLDPLGHTPAAGKDVAKEATCTENGYTTHVCSRCGATYEDSFVNALGHNFVTLEHVSATCEHAAYKKQLCSRCGEENVTGGNEQKKAHQFDDSGVCKECGKSVTEANLITWENDGKPVPVLTDTKANIAYAPADTTLAGHLSKEDADALVKAGCKALMMNFGNPDTTSRSFVIRTNAGNKNASATALKALDRHTYGKLALKDDNGDLLYGENGLSFTLQYAKNDTKAADNFYVSTEPSWNYQVDQPASYFIDGSNGRSRYYEGKGYMLFSTDDAGSFVVELDGRYLQNNIDQGKTKLALTFIPAFVSDTGDPLRVSYDFYAYEKGTDGVALRKQVAISWIHGGTAVYDATNNSYTHEIDLGTKYDFTDHHLEMNFSTSAMSGTATYAVYLAPLSMK